MAESGSKKEPTFEESLAELERLVAAIEEGKVGLQDAIAQYEKGTRLIHRCRSVLAEAEAKVQQLQVAQDGKPENQKGEVRGEK